MQWQTNRLEFLQCPIFRTLALSICWNLVASEQRTWRQVEKHQNQRETENCTYQFRICIYNLYTNKIKQQQHFPISFTVQYTHSTLLYIFFLVVVVWYHCFIWIFRCPKRIYMFHYHIFKPYTTTVSILLTDSFTIIHTHFA